MTENTDNNDNIPAEMAENTDTDENTEDDDDIPAKIADDTGNDDNTDNNDDTLTMTYQQK